MIQWIEKIFDTELFMLCANLGMPNILCVGSDIQISTKRLEVPFNNITEFSSVMTLIIGNQVII